MESDSLKFRIELKDVPCTRRVQSSVSDDFHARWEKWTSKLPLLEQVSIPQSFKPNNFGKVVSKQLHSLSDALRTGYSQASYLCVIDENGQVHCSFVAGEARVTPQKTVSIPRLELAAVTVSVRVADMLKAELDYKDVEDFNRTDSEVVLGFINSKS